MLAAMFDNVCGGDHSGSNKKPNELVEQINNVKNQLSLVEELFNNSEDEDLIEACIYQSKAFDCYYRYLLKLAKEEKCSTVPQMEPLKMVRVAGLL